MPDAGLAKHSLAHQHVFTVIRTLIAEGRLTGQGGILRVLDVGCGDGRMMAALVELAERHLPGVVLDVHGFDIGEHGFSDDQQMREALQFLTMAHPTIPWTARLRIVHRFCFDSAQPPSARTCCGFVAARFFGQERTLHIRFAHPKPSEPGTPHHQWEKSACLLWISKAQLSSRKQFEFYET